MWGKIKGWAKWVYDWATVITASLIGVPTLVLDFISTLSSDQLAPFIGADRALRIVVGVAVAKAAIEYVKNVRAARS